MLANGNIFHLLGICENVNVFRFTHFMIVIEVSHSNKLHWMQFPEKHEMLFIEDNQRSLSCDIFYTELKTLKTQRKTKIKYSTTLRNVILLCLQCTKQQINNYILSKTSFIRNFFKVILTIFIQFMFFYHFYTLYEFNWPVEVVVHPM